MKKILTLILAMTSCTLYAQVPGGDMENWHNYTADTASLQAPNSWFGSDEALFWADTGIAGFLLEPYKQVFFSGSSHSGNGAARIESLPVFLNGNFFTGAISTDTLNYIGVAVIPDGGNVPVSGQVAFVNAWTRYMSQSNDDTGSMVVTAYMQGSQGDSVIGGGTVNILPSANYVNVSALVQYPDMNAMPTSLAITFYSSKNMIGGADTSRLWVDDVTISTTSVNGLVKEDVVRCYPNPSNGVVSIYNTLKEAVIMEVFTANGQKVITREFKGNDVLDMSAVSSGIYFFNVLDKQGHVVQRGKLNILK